MSSAWNHAPNRFMVVSLRAARPSSRSLPKGCSYSTSFRPIYAKSLDPPTDAELNPSSPRSSAIRRIRNSADPSSCEFWCSLRLNKSHFDQISSPSSTVIQPWVPIFRQETGPIREVQSGSSRYSKRSRLRRLSLQKNAASKPRLLFADASPSDYLIDAIQSTPLFSENAHGRSWVFSETSREPLGPSLSLEQRQSVKQANRGSLQVITADYIQFVLRFLRKWDNLDVLDRSPASKRIKFTLKTMIHNGDIGHLESRQYEITDVMGWGWALTSETVYEAILRIFLLEAEQAAKPASCRKVPLFISRVILWQELDLKSFRLLLVYSIHLILGRPIPPLDYSLQPVLADVLSNKRSNDTHVNGIPSMDPSTCASFVLSLLFHARRLWPEAQLPIAQALVIYLRNSAYTGTKFMAGQLNKFLWLLSLPSGPRPFLTASVRQEAQFELLKAMAEHKPALPVTRIGYQGLAAAQLAHKKTTAERESAELKAPSWPPWKEERSGMDSTKGIEGTKSRAMRVLSQMREAGYSHSRWEEVTGILAGWDTDNSPTIQTRALARSPGNKKETSKGGKIRTREPGHSLQRLRGIPKRNNHPAIWEARLRSTRTLREAWACFTAYETQGFPPRAAIYFAMGEKLVYGRTMAKEHDGTRFALPGDGPEVFPEPESARDWIYTPSEPPTLSQFLKLMLSHGIRPSGRFLGLLLHRAPSFQHGLNYLKCSNLTNQQLRVMLSFGEDIPASDTGSQQALDELPEHLFTAFIRFLCRFSVITSNNLRVDTITTANAFPILNNLWGYSSPHISTLFAHTNRDWAPKKTWYPKLLCHAITLLQNRNSRNPQGWVQLLAGLRSARILGSPSQLTYHTQMILAWHEVMEVITWLDERNIELGSEGFQCICRSFSDAVAAGVKDQESLEEGLKILAAAAERNTIHPDLAPPNFEDMVNTGLATLKSQFDKLVLLDPKTAPLFDALRQSLQQQTESQVIVPALPHVPSPAALHMFVRSLGMAEDSEGLLSLLRWMSRHAQTLKQASDEYANGEVIMRRTIVATSMFLEGYWGRRAPAPTASGYDLAGQIASSDSGLPTFADPSLQEAYDIVTATEVWGPWPSNDEVWEYLAAER
ncbi:hypothetical protein BDV18DRAFT_130668 [Aspergillus unguis]